MKNKLFILSLTVLYLSNDLTAQKAQFDPGGAVRDTTCFVAPTVLDKMIAIDGLLGKGKVEWKAVGRNYLNYLDPEQYKDKKVMIPVIVGMRMSDGALSVMAKDVEFLNRSVSDIEKLSKEHGVSDGVNLRARKIKAYANRKQWGRAFFELGSLRKDLQGNLAEKERKNRSAIITAASWLEGIHIMTAVIRVHEHPEATELLRDQTLVKHMIKELEAMDAETKEDIVVRNILITLKEISKLIDLPLFAKIPKESVTEIHALTSKFRKLAITNKR